MVAALLEQVTAGAGQQAGGQFDGVFEGLVADDVGQVAGSPGWRDRRRSDLDPLSGRLLGARGRPGGSAGRKAERVRASDDLGAGTIPEA